MTTSNSPGMFSDLTSKELRVLGAKLDHGGRFLPDRNMENEIMALSAEVHDLGQHRLEPETDRARAQAEAAAGGPAPEKQADQEAEAGQ